MAARIPEHIIDEVRSRTDIVDLISEFLPLKKRGKNFFGLCPFHHEKTPSFSVNPERQIFHCFGCSVGGNVFTFLMEYEKLSFWEALTFLAKRSNVALPQKDVDPKQKEEYDALFYANQIAAEYYYKMLVESKEGQGALHYVKGRGFSEETISKFTLGYAPPGWENLLDVAQKRSLSPDVLRKAGLAIPREKGGGYYDRFRDRVIFPIANLTGKIVGFGGRILTDSEEQPKYVNSPETPIYNKGKILYGLFQARNAVREGDRVIVVEGYTDMISLFQAGILNVVASSGTAFTSDQARLIGRYTKNVVLLFDADSAGSEAALRGVETLLENDLDVDIVSLPPGTDPDSYVKAKGENALRGRINNADSFVDFIIKKIGETQDLSTVRGRAQAVEKAVSVMAKIRDGIKRSLWIKKVSENLSVDEGVIHLSVNRARRTGSIANGDVEIDVKRSPSRAAEETAEHGLLRIILTDTNYLKRTMEELTPDDFQNPDAREIATVIFQLQEDEQFLSSSLIIDHLRNTEAKNLVSLLSVEEPPAEERHDLFEGYLRFMKQDRIARKLAEVREQMKKAQKEGREEQVLTLMAQFQELSRLKENLKKNTAENRQYF